MTQEIELKFLVDPSKLPELAPGDDFIQAYLCLQPAVRVRIINGNKAKFTAKGEGLKSRGEIEFDVPLDKAQELVRLSPFKVIHKTRHKLKLGAHTWEIDFYDGELAGLVTAEVELRSEHERVQTPDFVIDDVTHRPEYKNSNLAAHGLPH